MSRIASVGLLVGGVLALLAPASVAAAATSVTNVAVTVGPPSTAAGATTDYTVSFRTSSTGGLSGPSGTIDVTLPSATGGGGGGLVGQANVGSGTVAMCEGSTTMVRCTINGGQHINPDSTVTVTLVGVVNPPAGFYSLTVATSADTLAAISPMYQVTAAGSVTGLSVGLSPSSGAGATTTYSIGFMSSGTGALAGDPPGVISITMPPGTGIGSLLSGTGVSQGDTPVAANCSATATTVVQCVLGPGAGIGTRAPVLVTLVGVVNPAAGTYTLGISTSSDTTSVNSPSYTVGGAPAPTIKRLKPARGAVGKRVIIKGTNLTGAIHVAFNGTAAVITSDTAAMIVTKVPAGATTGKITVTTAGGTATSIKTFTVT